MNDFPRRSDQPKPPVQPDVKPQVTQRDWRVKYEAQVQPLPPTAGRPHVDFRAWTADGKTSAISKDVAAYQQGGKLELGRLTADVGKDIKAAADRGPKNAGTYLRVELTHVQVGKNSEAQQIEKILKAAGVQAGVHVTVTAREGNRVLAPDGHLLKVERLPDPRVEPRTPESPAPKPAPHPRPPHH